MNINTATAAELQLVNGIGEVLAQRIIAARPIADKTDLQGIKGIGRNRSAKFSRDLKFPGK